MAADSPGTHNEEESDDEREVTPVGQASKALLELSTSNGDQNTRAYQAPRELLDLARRQQAKRAQARAAAGSLQPSAAPQPAASLQPSAAPRPAASLQPSAAPRPAASLQPPVSPRLVDDDAAPPRAIGESMPPRDRPTQRPGRSQRMAESSTPSISVESMSGSLEGLDSTSGLETPDSEQSDPLSVNDAAPSVARSRPSRALSDEAAPSSTSSSSEAPPASLSDLVRAANEPDAQPSIAVPSSRGALPDSAAASSARQPQRMPLSVLVMIISICLLIGFVLAKWRGIELLLPHH
jgi:hypothetical protein